MPRRKRTWGGARSDAGRPRIGPERLLNVSVQLPGDVVDYLDGIAFRNAEGEFVRPSRSETLRRILAIGAKAFEEETAGRIKAPQTVINLLARDNR